jgi:NTP pyrophosphatase (non-canonical NTP hydrolase)
MNDNDATVKDLKDLVQAYCEARDWDQFHAPKELVIGVVTEAAELLEPFRFKNDDEIRAMLANPEKREKIAHEAADTLYFLLRFCQMNNIDLTGALQSKMTHNERRYPVEKAKGSNKKYNEL